MSNKQAKKYTKDEAARDQMAEFCRSNSRINAEACMSAIATCGEILKQHYTPAQGQLWCLAPLQLRSFDQCSAAKLNSGVNPQLRR